MSDQRKAAIEAMARSKITPIFLNGGGDNSWEIWKRLPCGTAKLVETLVAETSYRDVLERQEQVINLLRATAALDALLAILPALGLRVVPVEADMKMVSRALDYPARLMKDDDTMYHGIYRAMTAAAPNVLGRTDGE